MFAKDISHYFGLCVLIVSCLAELDTEQGCPPLQFGLRCEFECHCPLNDVCSDINGLCQSGSCHYNWTGASCQTRHPQLRYPPNVYESITDCAFIVAWSEWTYPRDIGEQKEVIAQYSLQVQHGSQNWETVESYSAERAINFSVQYLVSNPSYGTPHSFRILLYRRVEGKIVPSIPGPESPDMLLPCQQHYITKPALTVQATSTVLPVKREPAVELPLAMTTESVYHDSSVGTHLPIDHEVGPIQLPLPVTLIFTEDNQVRVSLVPEAMAEIQGHLWLSLNPQKSYNKEYKPTWSNVEISNETGVSLGQLPPGTQYKLRIESTDATSMMVPVEGFFWTPPFKPPVPAPPVFVNVTNRSAALLVFPLPPEQLEQTTPISAYQLFVENLNVVGGITFIEAKKQLEFEAHVKKDWLRLISEAKQHPSRSRRLAEQDDRNFYITAELPGNTTCNETIVVGNGQYYGPYHNVPLKADSEYRIWFAVASTLGEVTRRTFVSSPTIIHTYNTSFWMQHEENQDLVIINYVNRTVIIIMVLLLIIIIGVLITIYILWKRKYHNKYFVYTNYPRQPCHNASFHQRGLSNINNNAVLAKHYQSCDALEALSDVSLQSAQQNRNTSNSADLVMIRATNPISTKDISGYLDQQDTVDYTLANEFRSLPTKFVDSVTVATLPGNSLLNRSMEVIPYDKNRVKLAKVRSGDMYINASHIQSIDRGLYIVTQAPMTITMATFWQMVWEQEVGCIVMLMDLKELERPVCERYWPEEGVNGGWNSNEEGTGIPSQLHSPKASHVADKDHKGGVWQTPKGDLNNIKDAGKSPVFGSTWVIPGGDFRLQLINMERTAYYIIRDIKLIDNTSGLEREVTHFQFLSWTRCGLPPSVIPYVNFVSRVHDERLRTLPTLVHCHAGGGRSGVFVAVDSLLSHARQVGRADVLKCVTSLRMERPNLVKTFKQYKFVYQCLAELFDNPESRISGERFQFAFDNLLNVRTPNALSILAREYEKLRVRRLHRQKDFLAIPMTSFTDTTLFQSPKKRGGAKPTDISVLPPIPVDYGEDCEDSVMPALIGPVFLDSFRKRDQMIAAEYPTSENQDDFWQLIITNNIRVIVDLNSESLNLPKFFPPLNTPFLNDQYKLSMNFQSDNPFESSSTKDFSVSNLNTGEIKMLEIRLFHWQGWPSDRVTPSVANFLKLVNSARNWVDRTGEQATIISLGCQIGRPALFCHLWSMCERLEDEWLVDVYTSTKHLQQIVPRAVNNLEQYRFLYWVMREHVNRIRKHGDITPASKRSRSIRLTPSIASVINPPPSAVPTFPANLMSEIREKLAMKNHLKHEQEKNASMSREMTPRQNKPRGDHDLSLIILPSPSHTAKSRSIMSSQSTADRFNPV